MQAVAVASERSSRWGWVGSANLLAAFSIMVAYSVVSGLGVEAIYPKRLVADSLAWTPQLLERTLKRSY